MLAQHLDAFVLVGLGEAVTELLRVHGEKARACDNRHGAAEAGVALRELEPDGARTDHGERLGQRGVGEQFAARPHLVAELGEAFDCWIAHRRAGGDDGGVEGMGLPF